MSSTRISANGGHSILYVLETIPVQRGHPPPLLACRRLILLPPVKVTPGSETWGYVQSPQRHVSLPLLSLGKSFVQLTES